MIKSAHELNSLLNNEKQLKVSRYTLKPIFALLEKMGNPHLSFPAIHVGGTNGKGSTAHFIHRILSDAGFKTGLYTSPHLRVLNERIRVGNDLIADDELEVCSEEVISIIKQYPEIKPTWFDAITAIAFRYFQQKKVDYAVVEVGLGGRLDSTNVVAPIVSIITNVDYDHTDVLGYRIEEIAREKAGIIKQNVPIVTAAKAKALKEIEMAANAKSAPLFVYGKDFTARGSGVSEDGFRRFDYVWKGNAHLDFQKTIAGIAIQNPLPIQVINAALAIAASHLIDSTLSDELLRKSLRGCTIPGRFDLISQKPLIIFDPAHNVSAIRAICEYLSGAYPQKRKIVVLHCMANKDVDGMISCIQNTLTSEIFYIKRNDERAFVPSDAYLEKLKIFENEEELICALQSCKEDALLFFTGTFRHYECALRVAQMLSTDILKETYENGIRKSNCAG
ncbi:MAG: bifunctional folylpolyglutamate synthase/dihydrofolate synthase [Spirochaetes bacterium]|nr:bifunctional folylpolyglutamate synthase/dihydrofolate synthase [Spirochaetota bacterium]